METKNIYEEMIDTEPSQPKNAGITRAVGIARVSSQKQVEGYSLSAQKRLI